MNEPKPNPDCSYCHGTGTVYDSVPYGSTNVSMPSECECMYDDEYGHECPICQGWGECWETVNDKTYQVECLTCNGTGGISQEKYDDIVDCSKVCERQGYVNLNSNI